MFLNYVKKYPKLLKSSLGLGFFKNYNKDIKAICKRKWRRLSIIFECFYLLKLSLWRKSLLQTYKQKYKSLYMHSFSFEYVFILVCVCNRIHWKLACFLWKIHTYENNLTVFMNKNTKLRFYFLKLSLWRKSLSQICKQKYESLYMHSFSFEYVFILVCTNFWVVRL